ncbi:MAG: DUF547 domain-containing protein [Nitrospinae bacterium CG11_big_fil_rev_8_21_14_0_20_45_15]|nr:MAG: DUF547 domain-containing protein [Nitrospinae bacterium CG11_big_fil_rev_8_21_14_0_20_45_15]
MHSFESLNIIRRASAFLLAIMILLVSSFTVNSVQAKGFDFSEWDSILKENVSTKIIREIPLNVLDYKKLKYNSQLKNLLQRLENTDISNLKKREEVLAFWINVYNILAVKMVLDHYPVKSIKDIGSIFRSVWKRPAGKVAGEERTLNDIEHEILRKMGEPRIHAAIVCASVSCPDLSKTVFVPETLDAQLDWQMKVFVHNSAKGLVIDREGKRVQLSAIFKWFAEDFKSKGGVLSFVGAYLSPEDNKFINRPDTEISYFDYDWGLNER